MLMSKMRRMRSVLISSRRFWLVHDAGIVDEHLQGPELVGRGEEGEDVGFLRHVALDGDGLAALRGDGRHHLVGGGCVGGVVDDDGVARRAELQRGWPGRCRGFRR